MAPSRFPEGTVITVDFTGIVREKTDNSELADLSTPNLGTRDDLGILKTTTRVQEASNEVSWSHLLYLGDSTVTGDKQGARARYGTQVRAQFTAVVSGEYQDGPALTTRVDRDGFIHYLYLDSPSVTVVSRPGEQAPAARITPATIEKVKVPGGRIYPGTREVESKDILARIADLENAVTTSWRVTRNRTGTSPAVSDFTMLADAERYLDEADLNPARFTISPVALQLSDENQAELDNLRKLSKEGLSTFGSEAWITRSVLLRNEQDCNGNWARDQAVEKFTLYSTEALEEWPFRLIDWDRDETVDTLLENSYLSVEFDNQVYWGKGTE